ncbi:hypothetical protein BH11MYX1_BH11MYX1_26740 [soil metagenome]
MVRIAAVLAMVVACGSGSRATDGGGTTGDGSDGTHDGTPGSSAGLHVVRGSNGANAHIVDANGNNVSMHGADRSSTEYACVNGNVFSGAHDQASIEAMKSWHINSVRVPLNEDCWLGINGIPAASSGQNYRDAIRTWVTLLESHNMIVILDLHWAAPGTQKSDRQLGMADLDHAPEFWMQVATAYAADHASVIFDLFNEPFITDWDCWVNGGTCAKDANNATYQVAGMNQLLAAVRATGADNVVIMGGLSYAADFTQWVAKVETIADPTNVAASWHAYSDQSVQTLCPTSQTCADGATTAMNYGIPGVLAAGYPVVVGEIGIGLYSQALGPYSATQATQLTTWLESLLTWVDGQGQG